LLVNSNWFEKIFTIKRSFFYFLDLLKIKIIHLIEIKYWMY